MYHAYYVGPNVCGCDKNVLSGGMLLDVLILKHNLIG